MNNGFVPDRWQDCGPNYGPEEKTLRKCRGCGEYYDDDDSEDCRYCSYCTKVMLNDEEFLRYFAHEIEEDDADLKTLKQYAKEDLSIFLDCCDKKDKEDERWRKSINEK